MEMYYGTKAIKARPMTWQEYHDYRGRTLPGDENGTDSGYLVEYVDGGGANHPDHEGYISWSPADVFDRAYQPTTAMSFGQAIEAMKVGQSVARAGWGGDGAFAYLRYGRASLDYREAESIEGISTDFFSFGETETGVRLPSFRMRTAKGSILEGWVASQIDKLAEDWRIV